MFLKKAKINGFGKLINKEFNFKPGLNIIFGQNESGKTTLAKFLLYTLSEPSTDALKYKPWYSEEFGGFVECSEGVFNFGEASNEKYSLNLLESLAFVMEDDDLENVKIDKNIIESSLKKKSEKTEAGKAIKIALNNLEKLNISECFNKLSLELEKIKLNIEEQKKKISLKNQYYLSKKRLSENLSTLEKKFIELSDELQRLRLENVKYLQEEISRKKASLNELNKFYEEIKWVEEIDQNVIFELSSMIVKVDTLKAELNKLEAESKAIENALEQKNREIDERFKLIGAISHEDLESISLRLKHLSLLAKMYGENISEASSEEPLWHLFIDDPNIIDRAE
ncbi:MAG: ATP-binding protein, partial [Fervidobacterium sp.]